MSPGYYIEVHNFRNSVLLILIVHNTNNYSNEACENSFYVSTWLVHGMSKYLVKHYFWVCLWRCSWKRLTLLLVDWIKQVALPHVGGHDTIFSCLNRMKRQRKAEFILWLLNWEADLLPSVSLFLRPLYLDWNLTFVSPALRSSKYTTCFPGFPACREKLVKLLSLHNHMSH